MTDHTIGSPAKPPTVAEDLRAGFMGSLMATVPTSAAELLFEILASSTKEPPPEGEEDPRSEEIEAAVMKATPAVRTRAAQLATALGPILNRCRSLILATKAELEDPDVSYGNAEILPDGWLVVTMAGEPVGRVPYDPARGPEDAGRMAEEMLSEHVRLHVARSLEPAEVPIPNDAGEMPPRPDGVRARRLVVM